MPSLRKSPRIFYGWYIAAVCFLCWFAADAFGWYTFGIFLGPISKELGWTTVMLTGALTLRTIIGGLSGPLVGPLADTRYGARILMTVGVLVAGAVPLLVSRVQALWQFYLIYGVFGALAMVGFGGLVTNTVLAKWFIRRRGRAIGFAAMGVSTAGMVFVPLVHFLIARVGWRTTLVLLALIIWGLTFFPVILLVRRRPEDLGLLPDGESRGKVEADANPRIEILVREEVWTLKEALGTKTLWMLLLGFNLVGVAINGAFLHFYPFLVSEGFSSNLATTALTTLAFCCFAVKLPWGILAERVHVRHCATVCYAGCAVSLGILLHSQSLPFVFLSTIAYGATLGGDMVLREMVYANYFGRTFLGAIRGVVMPLNLISSSGGPLFAAWLRDATGSYHLPYTVFLIVAVLGTFILYLTRPPVKRPAATTGS